MPSEPTTSSEVLPWHDGPTLDIVPDWIEAHCVVPDGDFDAFGNKPPFELRDYQLCFIGNHYAVREDAATGVKSAAFERTLSALIDAQKKGKSPLAAAIICVEAVGPALFSGFAEGGEVWDCSEHNCNCGWVYHYEPGEPMARQWTSPLIQITANSEDQTANTFDALRPMIDYGPLAWQIPHTGEEVIRLPGGKHCQIVPVTAKATSRLGQRVTFVLWDEAGLYFTSKMWMVYRTQSRGLTAMGGRGIITTNPDDPATDNVVKDLVENRRDKTAFVQHVEPPKSLKWTRKADRRKILKFVYSDAPWVLMNLPALEADIERAMRRDPAETERFYGNRRVQGSGSWMKEASWDGKAAPREVPDGTAIVLGGDLSNNNDWTGFRAMTLDGYQFTPTYGPNKVPTIWRPNGPGGLIPRGEVRAAFNELQSRYTVVRSYMDPAGSARGVSAEADAMEVVEDDSWRLELKQWQAEYQINNTPTVFAWETSSVSKIHPVLESFKQAVNGEESEFRHDGCPDTKTHILNAIVRARTGQRYILGKPNEHQKIDQAMSAVLCFEAWSDALVADDFSRAQTDNRMWCF
ncbi:hypothetical protein ACHABQ_02965 [Nesterenkonia aurantiaca]|uniref:hypothetical protein n=1 Tax=Nesterenkonia aurantiaca TaxID=1436010 RepID=UPI003EE43E55